MKKFCDMSLWEMADVLINGKMPDDNTPIDLDTRKASLSRILPMMLECAYKDREVLNDFPLKDDEIKRQWKTDLETKETMIKKAKIILDMSH